VVKELNLYLRAARELSQKLDHEPSCDEIARLLDRPVEDVVRMLGLNERVSSLDATIAGDTEKTLVETLADPNIPDPTMQVQDDDMRSSLDGWIDQLPEKQREVLARRFGLRGHEVAYAGRGG
jgi:RNA polymerase nonessential primary-like sigma factor